MVMFPNGGMSAGNGSTRLIEDGYHSLSNGDAPKLKDWKISEPEENAAKSGGEKVGLNLDSNGGVMTESGVPMLPLEAWENHLASEKSVSWDDVNGGDIEMEIVEAQPHEAVGTSTGLEVQEIAGLLFCDTGEKSHEANDAQMLPLEAWENHLASEESVSWDNVNGDDFEMEIVGAQPHEAVGTSTGLEVQENAGLLFCDTGENSHKANGAQMLPLDARSKVRDVLRTYQTVCRKLLQGEEARCEEGKEKIKRIDIEAAKILKQEGIVVNTEPHHVIGPVPGVEVGDKFQYRVELAIVGIHRIYQGGIDWATVDGQKVAVSIVASGGYADDLGDPNVLIYSGQGKQAEYQKLERGNLALWNSMTLQNPVRVVRGTKETKSKIVTKYVYDGLYTVEEHWQVTGEHGKRAYMFKLRRNEGQPEVAWKASKKAAMVRLDDIAQKKELYPISAVNTVDDEKPPAFNYIKEVMYPKSVQLQPGRGCSCSGDCSGSRCSCAVRNGGEIPYYRSGAIVETKATAYECGPHCKCPPSCYNRVSQSGIKLPLEVFKTDGRGWGVRALTYISSGTFICEYTGEILDEKEAGKRTNIEYLFDIGQKHSDSDTETGEGSYSIDALRYGNVGRFVNHSCSPNLYAQNVIYDHDDKRLPHIMLFAAENIPPLQELTYDYNYSVDQVRDSDGNVKVKECRCGATGCTGRLY